jgi:hypothetical protein
MLLIRSSLAQFNRLWSPFNHFIDYCVLQLPVERAPASVGEIWSTAHLGLKIRDAGEEMT